MITILVPEVCTIDDDNDFTVDDGDISIENNFIVDDNDVSVNNDNTVDDGDISIGDDCICSSNVSLVITVHVPYLLSVYARTPKI